MVRDVTISLEVHPRYGSIIHGIVGTAGEAGSEMAFSDDGMSHWVMYRRSNLYVLSADLIRRETLIMP